MTTTLALMRELYRAAPRNGDSYARGQRLLAQGYAAYAIDGDWAWPTYRTLSETLRVGIAPLPPLAGGAPAAPLLGGSYLMRHAAAAVADADLAALVGALQRPAAQQRLSAALGRLPARADQLADATLQADPARAAAAALAPRAPGLPPTPAARCAVFAVEVYLYGALTEATPRAGLPTRMQREALACLARQAAT